jgi:hypothetical protein
MNPELLKIASAMDDIAIGTKAIPDDPGYHSVNFSNTLTKLHTATMATAILVTMLEKIYGIEKIRETRLCALLKRRDKIEALYEQLVGYLEVCGYTVANQGVLKDLEQTLNSIGDLRLDKQWWPKARPLFYRLEKLMCA